MSNRRNNGYFLVFSFAMLLPIAKLTAQTLTGDIKTTGACSPVVVQPKDGFQIICHDTSLTRREALKQAQQISELLSRLRATSQTSDEVIQRLDKIIQALDDIKTTATPRHLSKEERDAIAQALQPYAGATISLWVNMGDGEAGQYASEFVSIFRAAGLKGVEGGGYGSALYQPPIPGIQMRLNSDDLTANRIPLQCQALGQVIYNSITAHNSIMTFPDPSVKSGNCSLIIGRKKDL